jgi:hypothetical protein
VDFGDEFIFSKSFNFGTSSVYMRMKGNKVKILRNGGGNMFVRAGE